MKISALIALISLNVTDQLVQGYGFTCRGGQLPIASASVTTPIKVTTQAPHGMPPGRTMHAVVSGVVGTVEANGLWILSYVDDSTLALSTLDGQGNIVQSVGVHAYVSGGTISIAFPIPDGRILLGRRNVSMQMAVVSPRIVFVPTDARAWGLEPYGAAPDLATVPRPGQRGLRGNAEQQAMTTLPQVATEFPTFEVYVSAAADGAPSITSANPDPDALDFDAVQALSDILYATMFDMFGGRVRVLKDMWPSQRATSGTMSQRGQQRCLIVEVQQPVTHLPASFVPIGTVIREVFTPEGASLPGDSTTITVS